MSPDAGLAACRFVHDAATMLVWGAYAYLATLVPVDLAAHVAERLSGFRVTGVVLAVVTTCAALPLEAAAIGDGWRDALDATTLGAVLFDTRVGQALQVQAVVALLLAASLAIPTRSPSGMTAVLSGLSLATLALTGHAAMHEGWLGLAHRINDAAHVLAGGAWLGSLVPLLLILRALDDASQRRDAGLALRRFSTAGHGAVALVIATGAVNTLLVLGRWPLHAGSPYQALLATKIALVLVMTLLALANRYVLVPRMAGGRMGAVRLISIATIVETGLGLAAIACVSVFGRLEPM